MILPVVVYGCETWSLTLREELRLRVFEKRILRRIICYLHRALNMVTQSANHHMNTFNFLYRV